MNRPENIMDRGAGWMGQVESTSRQGLFGILISISQRRRTGVPHPPGRDSGGSRVDGAARAVFLQLFSIVIMI